MVATTFKPNATLYSHNSPVQLYHRKKVLYKCADYLLADCQLGVEMGKSVLVVNGPNLNLLGTREPEIYGHTTLKDIEELCESQCANHGLDLRFMQSNHEGELLDAIHSAAKSQDGIIINAGAFTHTSVALHDALKAVGLPCVEVHLSNTFSREEFRHHSFISAVAVGVICGFGANSYRLAIDALANYFEQ